MTIKRYPHLTIQCDFDDTIVLDNLTHVILEAFAQDTWRAVNRAYERGEIIVERVNQLQWSLVHASREEIQEFVVKEARVRDGFPEFVDYCRGAGVRLVVVSNGLDLYIEPVLEMLGLQDIEHYCGKATLTERGIEIRYIDPSGVERGGGFKLACLQHLQWLGDQLVYIGDGMSDIVPALQANHVIARHTLAQHLESHHHPYFPFETFYDVIGAVKGLCEGPQKGITGAADTG